MIVILRMYYVMVSKVEQKVQTHEEILRSAVRLVRERGIEGMSVADVMRGAGLTVGGFYAHFASKDALVGETMRQALREQWGRLTSGLEGVPVEQRWRRVVGRYLSVRHRDEVNEGCPLPAVLSELPGQSDEVRASFEASFEENLRGLAGALERDEDQVLALVALMGGALMLSRALRGSPLSERVLRAAKSAALSL